MDDWLILLILAVPLLVMWLWALVDVLRRPDLSVVRRIGWAAVIVFVPIIGLAVYVVVRPPRRDRLVVQDDVAGATRAAAVVDAAEANRRGDLSDDDYRSTIAELTGAG